MSLASILSVLSTLVMIGVILMVAININYFTSNVEDSLEINVFLEDNLTDEEKEMISFRLSENNYVDSVTYKSKAEALADFSETLDDDSHLLKGYDEETSPLPDSYILKLTDSDKLHEVANLAKGIDGVDDAVYGEQTVETMLEFNYFANLVSFIVFILLSSISIFIIYNTIKLTVYYRKTDIFIMKYVGATNAHIGMPFVIEGSLLGLFGSAVAILLIRNLYYYISGVVQSSLMVTSSTSMLAPPEMVMRYISIIFVVYGIFIGAVGSLISLKKHLKV